MTESKEDEVYINNIDHSFEVGEKRDLLQVTKAEVFYISILVETVVRAFTTYTRLFDASKRCLRC